ncbi:hypothetical protein [Paeniglutamicibacter cryotolerans]|uniref:Uncharacterized protein n=1 Tax=Paeniglutamicibacter cryotolerans TaxID=670079 RepID=A0A839QMF0_9MICC|nr:hypothetical protein [Paeniglutamicibacter cryotolerans]MBB2994382.1 hypothetical protein [Paeniglutamicibacter cryotolerans]
MRIHVVLLSALASAGLVAAGFSAGTLATAPTVPDSYQADAALLPGTIAQLSPAPTRIVTRAQLLGANAASVQLVGSPAYTAQGYQDSMQAYLDAARA